MQHRCVTPVTATQPHLASKDDNFMDCSRGLIISEPADDSAGPGDSEVLVARHGIAYVGRYAESVHVHPSSYVPLTL